MTKGTFFRLVKLVFFRASAAMKEVRVSEM